VLFRSVYIRRDPRKYETAWVWAAENDEYLGQATLTETIPLMADTPITKENLKIEIGRKRAEVKAAREATAPKVHLSANEIMRGMAKAAQMQSTPNAGSYLDDLPPVRFQLTEMDHAATEQERLDKIGTGDLEPFMPATPEKKKQLRVFDSDQEESVVNGQEYQIY
jgi:hypothetical protein